MPEYDRPIEATLHVHLANGETWEAGADDLAKFGLVLRHDAYMRFDDALRAIFRDAGLLRVRGDLADMHLNPVRFLVEMAIVHPDLLDHPEHNGWADVVDIERRLRQAASEESG